MTTKENIADLHADKIELLLNKTIESYKYFSARLMLAKYHNNPSWTNLYCKTVVSTKEQIHELLDKMHGLSKVQ